MIMKQTLSFEAYVTLVRGGDSAQEKTCPGMEQCHIAPLLTPVTVDNGHVFQGQSQPPGPNLALS